MLFALMLSPNSGAQITIPENAQLDVYGSGWVCRNGFKKVNNACKKITPAEAEQ